MPKLVPPANGVAVRMYRQGHGDCFLLALPRDGGGDPVYVLVDCGFKPGSPAFVHGKPIDDVVAHIIDSTGAHLDLVILTHEHQDHLNGIWKKNEPYFAPFEVDEAWLSWTEDPTDDLANQLREDHHDQLLNLVKARHALAIAGGADISVATLDRFLAFELGGGDEVIAESELLAAAEDPTRSVNKQAMKLIKDKASQARGVSYLSPGRPPRTIDGVSGVRVFVLGPPRSADLIADEDPVGSEAFPDESHNFTFGAAVAGAPGQTLAPFSPRFAVPFADALGADGDAFFAARYGRSDDGQDDRHGIEVPNNASWRRIDSDWLHSAEQLALKLNTGINNTSLVLAFELRTSGKVLFFAGDAQRGNWISWTEHSWQEAGHTIDARDLLARTVLYKVGHHGSHNATLAGTSNDAYPNLAWMGIGASASEFTAMITAVNEWALTKNDPPWRHPLPSIKEALVRKAQGRVFQTDEDEPTQPDTVSDAAWEAFRQRCVFDQLFFDYTIIDE